jgi:dual specificity tyrosine-phosphorylation-regulated kinase 2/3/4
MQMNAIPSTTAQRVATLKPINNSSSSSSSSSAGLSRGTSMINSSRATSQTISSMQKQSDTSLRGNRHHLPTIAGSPSVGINGQNSKETSLNHNSTISGTLSAAIKETPTKIPRISSRSSVVTSPGYKSHSFLSSSRRASLNVAQLVPDTTEASITAESSVDEFGILENDEATGGSRVELTLRQSNRSSPSMSSYISRTQPSSSTISSHLTFRKSTRESTLNALRKTSTGSISSFPSVASESLHRLLALSPSNGINKLLTPKTPLPAARMLGSSTTPNLHQVISSASSSRQSLSTPSLAPSSVDEDEVLGDEEMKQYIKRQQARKLASGAKKEELDELLRFPEPISPTSPSSPLCKYHWHNPKRD